MADEEVTLTEDLFDRRDPQRPAIFIAPRGTSVKRSVLEALGVAAPAVKARREADVEDKALKPAATKRTKKD